MGYCPSAENPSDLGSRGTFGSDLKDEKLWWNGSLWLSQEEHNWPQKANIICIPEREGEKKISSVTALIVEITEPCSINQGLDISRYSSLRKLVRVTALVLRFIHKLRTQKVSQHDENELTDGEVYYPRSRGIN